MTTEDNKGEKQTPNDRPDPEKTAEWLSDLIRNALGITKENNTKENQHDDNATRTERNESRTHRPCR